MKVSTIIKPAYTGKNAVFGDENACVPISLANAFGISIEEATSICAVAGREKGKGMYFDKYYPIINHFGGKFIGFFGTTNAAIWYKKKIEQSGDKVNHYKGTSLKTFIENNRKGKFIIIVTGHATVLHNGVLIDRLSYLEGGKSVFAAWKVD